MTLEPAYELAGKPELLIVDGAGTLFDPGSIVPAYAFQAAFKERGIEVDFDNVMRYMGRPKREH
jgi:beta-phosphoglucomutase-like phosphatase (HAD superfamily)